ncbi:MAG TPA: hypothetical protein EYO32_04465 [Rhodospirillales bacterium]|nr:hypothetical protein [Rhodospirillales bacterium]
MFPDWSVVTSDNARASLQDTLDVLGEGGPAEEVLRHKQWSTSLPTVGRIADSIWASFVKCMNQRCLDMG